MFRKYLIDILLNQPTSLFELSRLLEEKPKDLEDDLHHLFKSLKNMPYRSVILPAACKKCGFIFNKDKMSKPGKCPMCKGTWISEPLIHVEEKH